MVNKFDKETLEQYLLGEIEDENLLLSIEDCLAEDEKFYQELELIEDELIEKYSNDLLVGIDLINFEKVFLNSRKRRKKIILSKALIKYSKENPVKQTSIDENNKESNTGWFSFSRKWAFGLALPVLTLVIIGFWFFAVKSDKSNNYIAQIDSLYQKNRPVQARIVDFKYLPHSSLRGNENKDDASKDRKRKILENNLLLDVEENPTTKNFNNLGVFYLTQKKYDDAIKSFKEALRISENNTEARSNLGVAYFEKAKTEEAENRLTTLAEGLEEITKAINDGDERLEILFNRALILQELNLPQQSIEAWQEYLQKDNKSKWAEEARKNLKELKSKKNASFKTKERILVDFVKATKDKNEAFAWKIHSQTKEFNAKKFLPYQLARSYLESDKKGNIQEAQKYIKALKYLGTLEKNKNADIFFQELAEYYSNINPQQKKILHSSHLILDEAINLFKSSEFAKAKQKFEQSRKLFKSVENEWEARILDVPIAFCLTRLGKLKESNQLLKKLEDFSRSNSYKWLLSTCLDWISSNLRIENEVSKSVLVSKEILKISEKTENIYEIQRISGVLSDIHFEIGETKNSLGYLSKSFAYTDLYNQSYMQTWRNLKDASNLFSLLGLHETSVFFGKEYLHLAEKEMKSSRTHLQLSNALIADLYLRKKEYAKALKYIKKSQKIESTIEDSFQKNIRLAGIKIKLAHLKRKTGNCEEAILNYEEAIKLYSKLSDNILDNYIARKGKLLCYQQLNKDIQLESELKIVLNSFEKHRLQIIEEGYRNVFFDNEQSVYDIAINFFLNKGNNKKAFEYSEKSKARSLLNFIQNGATITEDDVKYKGISNPLSLDEIQKRMPKNTQIVQYSVLSKKIVAWIITKDSFEKIEEKISLEDLNKKILDYIKTLKEDRNNEKRIKSKSSELYGILFKQIFSKVDSSKDIYIVADKILLRLPFNSLFSIERSKYLIEEFSLANTPSSTVFVITSEHAKQKPKNESLISIGNPDFNRKEHKSLDSLKSARREASEIATYYKINETYTGENATKEKFLENFDKSEIIHFAGHYVANEKSPLNSKLILAKTNTKDQSDLRVLDIAKRKGKHLKLVVLSACQTDVEQFYQGEGSIGAARIFLAIGTPVVVASYFEVDSDSTADLMINFHRYRKEKDLPVNRALRQAQIEMIQNKNANKQSPFYWAAFSTIGGFSHY